MVTTEPTKPNLLTKFDKLLGKYPNVAEATGKILLAIATGGLIK